MKYFYFNPMGYDSEYHVMAYTLDDAWEHLERYLKKEYKDNKDLYVLSPEQAFEKIKRTYVVEERGVGEVKETEVS